MKKIIIGLLLVVVLLATGCGQRDEIKLGLFEGDFNLWHRLNITENSTPTEVLEELVPYMNQSMMIRKDSRFIDNHTEVIAYWVKLND